MSAGPKILVVSSSLFGANAALADDIQGVLEKAGAQVRVRGVKQIVLAAHQTPAAADHPVATGEDLAWADGFVFTSPAHTGLLSAAMKAFIDENHDAAIAGDYLNKTFTGMSTTGFAHGGQERVVDELNAAASAWGCIIVPPSTANASLNELDGNPWGLSFVLEHGKLPTGEDLFKALALHLDRFVKVTAAVKPLIGPAPGAAAGSTSEADVVAATEDVNAPRANIADVLGKG